MPSPRRRTSRGIRIASSYGRDLQLALLLGPAAGVVNAVGILALGVLTTNVTGHAAFMAQGLAKKDWAMAATFLGWLVLFMAGSFTSGVLLRLERRHNPGQVHKWPMLIELALLTAVMVATLAVDMAPVWGASLLMFTMGLQNAMISVVSKTVVRTTHLTGLTTDVGLELAGLLLGQGTERRRTRLKLRLHARVAGGFLAGAVVGGVFYGTLGMLLLALPLLLVLSALLVETIGWAGRRPHIPRHRWEAVRGVAGTF